MGKLGSADVAAILRREIIQGTYRRHERLPASRDLAERHGVARNTLRGALTTLEDEGLLETRRGSGTFVVFEPEDVKAEAVENATPMELIDSRFALEPHICRLCVLHGRREDFDSLEALCDLMERSLNDPITFSEADTNFHRTLALTTRNRLLIWVIEQINSVRSHDEWTLMRHLTLNEAMIKEYNLQHRSVLEAIRAREPEQAARLMKTHLETARLSLTRAAET